MLAIMGRSSLVWGADPILRGLSCRSRGRRATLCAHEARLSTEVKHYFLPDAVKPQRSLRLDNGTSGITSSMASRYDVLD
jgi:hypothetical protein